MMTVVLACGARVILLSIFLAIAPFVRSRTSYMCLPGTKNPNCFRVLISGAGPAGLLSAHALMQHSRKFGSNPLYRIRILDSRGDPRLLDSSKSSRSYSLGLNIRGQSAVKYFDSDHYLWNAINLEGVESDSFFLHIGNKLKLQIRKPLKKNSKQMIPPTLLIPRYRLCAALLDTLEKAKNLHNDSAQNSSFPIDVTFDVALKSVDLNKKIAYLSDGTSEAYDLIIGSDGVNSALRKQMELEDSPEEPFICEESLLPGKFKVMLQSPQPPGLEPDAVHAMESTAPRATNNSNSNNPGQTDRFSMFLIPAPGNKTCALLSWKGDEPPAALAEGADPAFTRTEIERLFPQFGTPSEVAVTQLLSQRPSEVRTVRCNRYHSSRGQAVLLGDAAHSTGGTLGQGANSALLDVVALAKCLDESTTVVGEEKRPEVDIASALTLFSARQVKEGLSLWQLLQLPPKGPWGIAYQISQLFWGVLGRIGDILGLGRFIPKPTQILLSQTLTPFSAIVEKNRFWVQLSKSRER